MSGAMTQYYAIELRIMAASSASGGEGKLGATSEWLVANTGQLRSQFMEQAVKQLVSSLCEVLSYCDSHSELSFSSEVLLEVQDLCIPIASKPETLPLIEALVQHCLQERWKSSLFGGLSLAAPESRMSLKFLQVVIQLQRPAGRYDSPSKLSLSYRAQVMLWTEYQPALEQELLDMTEACLTRSEKSVQALVNARNLPKACTEHPKLLLFSESFLRELTDKSPEVEQILYIFNQEISSHRAKIITNRPSLTSLSRHIPCLHT